MLIIRIEIIKTIDERELQKKQQQKKNKEGQKGASRTEAMVTVWELNDFVVYLS